MEKQFKSIESYKHKFAKKLMFEWCKKNNCKNKEEFLNGISYKGILSELPHYTGINFIEKISLEQPFFADLCIEENFYNSSKSKNEVPAFVPDIAIIGYYANSDRDSWRALCIMIEIVHKSPISELKKIRLNEYCELNNSYWEFYVLEICADWILSQIKKPSIIPSFALKVMDFERLKITKPKVVPKLGIVGNR